MDEWLNEWMKVLATDDILMSIHTIIAMIDVRAHRSQWNVLVVVNRRLSLHFRSSSINLHILSQGHSVCFSLLFTLFINSPWESNPHSTRLLTYSENEIVFDLLESDWLNEIWGFFPRSIDRHQLTEPVWEQTRRKKERTDKFLSSSIKIFSIGSRAASTFYPNQPFESPCSFSRLFSL